MFSVLNRPIDSRILPVSPYPSVSEGHFFNSLPRTPWSVVARLRLSRATPKSSPSIMLACCAIAFLALMGCGGSDSNSNGPVSPGLTAITVIPAYSSIALGSNLQFQALGTYSDGSTKDLTASADWSSSNERMASISSLGVITPLATGGGTIGAAFGGLRGSTLVAITPSASTRLVWFALTMQVRTC